MTWLTNRPRRPGASGAAAPGPAPTEASQAAEALHPVIRQMLAELPTKQNWRPDEVMDYLGIKKVDSLNELISEGKLTAIRISPRIRVIPRASIAWYLTHYVTVE